MILVIHDKRASGKELSELFLNKAERGGVSQIPVVCGGATLEILTIHSHALRPSHDRDEHPVNTFHLHFRHSARGLVLTTYSLCNRETGLSRDNPVLFWEIFCLSIFDAIGEDDHFLMRPLSEAPPNVGAPFILISPILDAAAKALVNRVPNALTKARDAVDGCDR